MTGDLVEVLRRLRSDWSFACLTISSMAVAFSALTAVMSFADGVLLRPLPYEESDRVFVLQAADRVSRRASTRISLAAVAEVQSRHSGLGDVGLISANSGLYVRNSEGVERLPSVSATASYFNVLSVRPALGRLFIASDSPGETALLTYSAWRSRFNADRSIVGQNVVVGDSFLTVVGILPDDFVFPSVPAFVGSPEVVTLLQPPAPNPGGSVFNPVVRLEPGVSREQAAAELDAIASTLGEAQSKSTIVLQSVRDAAYPHSQPFLWALLGVAILFVLVGTANVANLYLIRNARRARDIAVRVALGASRIDILRPFLIEGLILVFAGAIMSLTITWVGFDVLLREVPRGAYGGAPVGVDSRIVQSIVFVSAISGVVIGGWSAVFLRSSTINLHALRTEPSVSVDRLGFPLLAFQVAAAFTLVIGALGAVRPFISRSISELGFNATDVLTVRLEALRRSPQRDAPYRAVLDSLASHPDVVAAGAVGSLPLEGSAPFDGIPLEDTKRVVAGLVHVLPGYFETAGIRLLNGRTFGTTSVAEDYEAVVSESAARTIFGNIDPIGRPITLRGDVWRVIGVVADVRQDLEDKSLPPVYVLPGKRFGAMTLIARVRSGPSQRLLDELRRHISNSAPNSLIRARWWSEEIADLPALRNARFQAIVLGSLGLIALAFAMLGTFSVARSLATARRREVAIRVAIGAKPWSMIRMLTHQVSQRVLLGIIVGVLIYVVLSRQATSYLWQFEAGSEALLIAISVMAISALIAALVGALVLLRSQLIRELGTNE